MAAHALDIVPDTPLVEEQPVVLVVDADPSCRHALRGNLALDGYEIREATSAASARSLLNPALDAVLAAHRLPDGDGFVVLEAARTVCPAVPVILLDARPSVESAIEAVKRGAFHYAPSNAPVGPLVRRAVAAGTLRHRIRRFHTSPDVPPGTAAIVGRDPAVCGLRALVAHISSSRASTVLLTGETGTGKDLVARTLHQLSERASGPFVTITCSALPNELLESELFGYEPGAFTDARQQKRGLLESANGGTVFLDEIGELGLPLQVKLLRFLEDKTIRRVGGLQDVPVDVRVIAATHRNLEARARDGSFREDLYYRLNVLRIQLPALRERREDVPLLAEFFIERFNRELTRRVCGLTPDAIARLRDHDWPGNVRELRNTIERAMLLTDRDWIRADDLGLRPKTGAFRFALPPGGVRLDVVERQLLEQALARTGGHHARTGALLGINRDQVRYRIRKMGLGRRRANEVSAG